VPTDIQHARLEVRDREAAAVKNDFEIVRLKKEFDKQTAKMGTMRESQVTNFFKLSLQITTEKKQDHFF
jgi:hypothetical protein